MTDHYGAIIPGDGYPIRPNDICVRDHSGGDFLWDTFDGVNLEHEASTILILFKEKESWEPFTVEEFQTRFNRPVPEAQSLRYKNQALIVELDDGRYAPTHAFVSRIFAEYPALPARIVAEMTT